MNLETKTTELRALFKDPMWPRLESCELFEQGIELGLFVPSTLGYFDGHFPQQPVLPGVVQVHWVGELSRAVFGCEGFAAMQNIKFINMALPQTALVLRVQNDAKKQQVKFQYSQAKPDEEAIVSSGVLKFQFCEDK